MLLIYINLSRPHWSAIKGRGAYRSDFGWKWNSKNEFIRVKSDFKCGSYGFSPTEPSRELSIEKQASKF